MITAWNVFGLADLVLAIALGVMSGQGSPLQVFHDAPGSAAMQHLPPTLQETLVGRVADQRVLKAIGSIRRRAFDEEKIDFGEAFEGRL